MGAQGYDIKQNILFQSNQSALNMEKDAKKLFTVNSKHIDIYYFFNQYSIESKKNQLHNVSQNTLS